jgi:UrcA family protein
VLALAAVPALQAGENDELYVLTYSARDLESVATVRDLYQRIRKLALGHCPDYGRSRDLAGRGACVNDVVRDLIRSIDHPALTAYADGTGDLQVAGEPDHSRDPS